MRTSGGERDADRDLVREALRRAPGPADPDVTRLVEAVPDLMTEARRRRSEAPAGLAAIVAARARWAIPKLVAATAAAVAIAAAVSLVERTPSNGASTSLESMILSGGEDRERSDILLEAVLAAEKNDG